MNLTIKSDQLMIVGDVVGDDVVVDDAIGDDVAAGDDDQKESFHAIDCNLLYFVFVSSVASNHNLPEVVEICGTFRFKELK
ncbi:5722_t:CDS:2 [Entrophospora sp. SA101]|nr:5722_t:CDS:2 [Entrophospora sp. SA101]